MKNRVLKNALAVVLQGHLKNVIAPSLIYAWGIPRLDR